MADGQQRSKLAGAVFSLRINLFAVALAALWIPLNLVVLPGQVDELLPESLRGTGVGAITFIGVGLAALVQPVAGRVTDLSPASDRRRPFMVVPAAAMVLLLFALALAPAYAILVTVYVTLQVTSNFAQAALQALIPDLVDEPERGLASGIKTALDALGIVLGLGGVALLLSLWRPYIFAAGVSALIGTGNAAILKPSEATSLTALELARMADGLFPPGMLNVVTGLGHTMGSAIVRHPGIPRIDFTGSVPTGKAIMREGSESLKRLSLELGGKNPLLVFPGVDIEASTVACIKGMNLATTMGQSCQSNSRVFVHEDLYEQYVDTLVRGVEGLKVGDPMQDYTDMGPMAFAAHYHRIMSYIEAGKQDGAHLVTGGGRPAHLDKGFYIEPTVFADMTMDMRIATEEIFGPVTCVLKWSDYDEMMRQANDVGYGLAAHIWCKDIDMANRAARDVHAGIVYINGEGGLGSPVQGYRNSSHGTVGDVVSYTQEKCVQITLR